MQRELIALRHAKSAWPLGVSDDRRPLNSRGRADAAAAGDWFAGIGPIDLILISPATRTQETAELAFSAPCFDGVTRQLAPNLYGASWWDVLDVVRAVDDEVLRVVVVGHNPGTADLVSELADAHSDPTAVKRVRTKFPTCSAGVLIGAESWSKWGTDGASLVEFRTPRDDVGEPLITSH